MKNLQRFYTPGDVAALAEFNRVRHDPAEAAIRPILERVFETLTAASRRLVVYGSLAPGETNHGVIGHLHGEWRDGWVHGERKASGWGAALGFPVLVWDASGSKPKVPVHVLTSDALTPEEWARLDAFEGAEYRRILVPVYNQGGFVCVGNIYEEAPEGPR